MQRLAEERGSGDREEDVQDERGGDDDGLRLGKAVRVGALVGVRVRVRVRARVRVRVRARVRAPNHIEAAVGTEPRRTPLVDDIVGHLRVSKRVGVRVRVRERERERVRDSAARG